MTRRRSIFLWLVSGLSVVSMACWLVMFLAGTDVWHFAGRPDIWNLESQPYADVRAFVLAFYVQFVVLVAVLAFVGWSLIARQRTRRAT